MTGASLCEFLEWDTDFFGFRIGRATVERLTMERARTMMSWSKNERIRCLYFLADTDSPGTIRLLENNRFRFQDIRLTMTRHGLPEDATTKKREHGIRPARAPEIEALREIARVSHTGSRFYHDPGFPRERCATLYETWIERSCSGDYADAVLIAEWKGRPAGYLSCRLREGGEGSIGLFAVDSALQGKGIGASLINASFAWFSERGVHTVTTVTQGANVPAQRAYQRSGFQTASVKLWYHRWFESSAPR